MVEGAVVAVQAVEGVLVDEGAGLNMVEVVVEDGSVAIMKKDKRIVECCKLNENC